MNTSKNEQKRRFILILLCCLLLGIGIVFLTFFLRSSSKTAPTSDTSVAKAKKIEGGIGTGSKAYNEKLKKLDEKQADEALETGDSYISIPTLKPKPLIVKKDPLPQKEIKQPRLAEKENRKGKADSELMKMMMEDIKAMEGNLASSLSSGSIEYVMEITEAPQENLVQVEAPQKTKTIISLRPGDILYAIVDTGINSDVPSAVMATVASGKYRDAKLLGKFARFEDKLVLSFNRIILPCGANIQINAFAVDPATTEGSVASKVDTHFFSRWGGLIASAFLEGFGDAKRYSGAQSKLSQLGEDTETMIWKDYDASEQAWIAAGKVGKKASGIFERNFSRPPTVYLDSGAEIGILIMDVVDKDKK